MAQWMTGTVVENKRWHDDLFSLRVEIPTPFSFTAGQFVRLGLPGTEKRIQRAYSLVNSPNEPLLDFLITTVPDGELSPRLDLLGVGDTLEVSAPPSGFFILSELPEGKTLWLISTGTGIGPYLSMLHTDEPWQRFEHVVLVHGVRYARDLCYQEQIQQWQQQYPNRFHYQPVVTRETVPNGLQQRIPVLIANGLLEKAVGVTLDTQAQVMICGNPAMIVDSKAALLEKGLDKNLRRKPGNVTVEQYWK
ncbi:ferredoxin--NADP(+) reductase [Aliidiomarina shirensis]|uniref:ferredoxin--NADP(+) reductase n=1 Tax=Aliidiomarina shirensis TaxID=1048642 RepID=A0A432WSQ5_9GAMM|nr:ferredoxin--NADP reductase [Aliidiomarina shirensis]RUO36802.1 ferredoxin--NADP(+) reductase [Aliidiomarina shirensis]